MSLNLGKLIGSGATSDVYEYGEGKVVKLYPKGWPADSVRWEYNKLFNACENKLPAPKVYDFVEMDNRFGFVMEHIQGDTLKVAIDQYVLRVIEEDIPLSVFAEQILDYIKLTARSLYEIHRITTNQIETMVDGLKRSVYSNQFLTDAENNQVVRVIEALPKGNAVCHGDPNPNNIIVNGSRYIFVDWVNSGAGNPLYDIAEYVLLMTPSEDRLPEGTHPKLVEFYNNYKDSIISTFLEEYEKVSGKDITNYRDFMVPLLVSKLNSNRTMEEKATIVDDIRRRLKDFNL